MNRFSVPGGVPNLPNLSCCRDGEGPFRLTEAVRPASRTLLQPQQGYRLAVYESARGRLPVLSAAVSAEQLFDVFLDLLPLLGRTVDVIVETCHGLSHGRFIQWRRSEIDRAVLASCLCEFEELLTHDGCTAIAVLASRRFVELQFDEHKLLHVYAPRLGSFRRRLHRWGVCRRRRLPLICETEHVHRTRPRYAEDLMCLLHRLSATVAQLA